MERLIDFESKWSLPLYCSTPSSLLSLFVGAARRGSGGEEGDDGGVALLLRYLERSLVLVTTERFVSAALLQLSLHDKHKAHCCKIDVDPRDS